MSCRDVFLCHASTDKARYVQPFAEELQKQDVSYWLYEAEIRWGAQISSRIDEGLRISRFVVVFLSRDFIRRNWPQAELSSALRKENSKGQTVVLPILIGDERTVRAIFEKYQLLAGKRCMKWNQGIPSIVSELKRLLGQCKIDGSATNRKAIWHPDVDDLVMKKELLDRLLKIGAILTDLDNSADKVNFANQMFCDLLWILGKRFGIPVGNAPSNDAYDSVMREIELLMKPGTSDILRQRIDRYLQGQGQSLRRLHNNISHIKGLLEESPVSPQFGEEVWSALTELYGTLVNLLVGREPSESSRIMQLVSEGESLHVEFKSSFRWDFEMKRINKNLGIPVAKTVAGFMNAEGGTLIVGVDDDGNVLGVREDLNTVGGSRDKYQRAFTQVMSNACGKESCRYLENYRFVPIYDKDVFVVMVRSAEKPIYLMDENRVDVYVRANNTTTLLNSREAIEYCNMRWGSRKIAVDSRQHKRTDRIAGQSSE